MEKKKELTLKQKLTQATSDRPGTFQHTEETRVKINGITVNALKIQKEGQANRYGYRPLRKRLREMFELSVYDPGQASEDLLVYKKRIKAG